MITFQTDGFRGNANEFSKDGLKRIGYELAKTGFIGKIVLGYDTRESSTEFRKALVTGINAANREVIDLGIVTTPTVAYFSQIIPDCSYALMITASHNPFYDNGIKIFQNGNKINSDLENKLWAAYQNNFNIENQNENISYRDPQSYLNYASLNSNKFDFSLLKDKKIIFDLANGSSSELIKKIYSQNNFQFFCDTPNGRNINQSCGITHPKNLEKIVKKFGAYLGITFDGDCDRVGFCDEKGDFVDGDHLLGFIAKSMIERKELKDNTLVVTEYSNLALDKYIKSIGGNVVRVKNGDKNVFAKMKEFGYNFGGEKLGHILFGTTFGTGDGFMCAKEVLSRLNYSKKPSEELRPFELNPQIILNIEIANRTPFEEIPHFQNAFNNSKKRLNGSGQLLIRYSGTENLCRIMVEGEDINLVNKIGDEMTSFFN